DEADAGAVENLPVAVVGIDDDHPRPVEGEMALDQRQSALADRAEADHHDRPLDCPVLRPLGHSAPRQSVTGVNAGIGSGRQSGDDRIVIFRATKAPCGRPHLLMRGDAPLAGHLKKMMTIRMAPAAAALAIVLGTAPAFADAPKS